MGCSLPRLTHYRR